MSRHCVDLMNDAEISHSTAQDVMTRVSLACAPTPVTVTRYLILFLLASVVVKCPILGLVLVVDIL